MGVDGVQVNQPVGAQLQHKWEAQQQAAVAAKQAAAAAEAREQRNTELDLQKVLPATHVHIRSYACANTLCTHSNLHERKAWYENLADTSACCPLQAAHATKVLAERKAQSEELAKAFHTSSPTASQLLMPKPTPPKDVEMGFLNTILQRAKGASSLPAASAPAVPATAAEARGGSERVAVGTLGGT